jgi:FkbH-like protein
VANNSNVKVLNPQRLDRLSPPPDRFDVESEVRWGFPYRLPHAATLAELLGQLIKGPVPKKGLITDLDDTLWKGVLGEVGSEEVSWDLDHDSHMHGLYQQLVHSLSVEGVLVGVASKNDPAYVEEVFRRNDVMLPSSAIFPMEVHWGPKSESVARILKTWNVGPDSVVFVDDSPMELAEVKAAHPEVECLQFPSKKHEAVLNLLDRLRDLFGKAVMSEEDAIRLDSIRQNQFNRDDGPRTAGSPSAFLQQANAELLISFRKDPLDPRALELVNKTNQFNLNGKRYTQLSWRNYLQGPCSFLLLAAYKDKYGPLGKIAVIAGRQKERTLFVDTWVMSCRAFGRRIEHRCLEELYAKYGIDEIEFDFAATGRNEPLRTFLADILDAPPSAGCRLPRDQFLDRRLETFHHVQEVNNG